MCHTALILYEAMLCMASLFAEVRWSEWVSEWVSSFLTAHQHIIGYSVPYNGLENAVKDGKYNQGYLATIKYEKRII